jgi:Cu+-exporting ATPase
MSLEKKLSAQRKNGEDSFAIDPICKMSVDKEKSQFKIGENLLNDAYVAYFCSAACLAKYRADVEHTKDDVGRQCCQKKDHNVKKCCDKKGSAAKNRKKSASDAPLGGEHGNCCASSAADDTRGGVAKPKSTLNDGKGTVMELNVPGMGSEHCAGRVRAALNGVPGAESIEVDIAQRLVVVRVSDAHTSIFTLRDAVVGAGYAVALADATADAAANGSTSAKSNVNENGNVRFIVPGMGSTHCAGLVQTSLQRVDGVTSVKTNPGAHRVDVKYAAEIVSAAALRAAVERGGYAVAATQFGGGSANEAHEIEEGYLRHTLRNFLIAFVPALLIMILMLVQLITDVMGPLVYLAIIAVLGVPVVFLFGGFATHVSAIRSLMNRTANMDVLISMGSAPPYLIGLAGFAVELTSFIEMATTIMTFHLLGRYLEARAKGRASQAIRKLLSMAAKTATVERDGVEIDLPVDELLVGDIMIIRPGAKVPTDGEVVSGASYIDESMATGESVPVEKAMNDVVIGATINGEGVLKVRATRVGNDTFLANVVRMIEEAQGSKVPIQEFADRMTGRFVPTVLLLSIVAFIMWAAAYEYLLPVLEFGAKFLPWVDPNLGRWQSAILASIAVLVISCPCALGLATPTAIMVGAGLGAEHGILIRSGEAIQTLRKVTIVALDKTGTITRGQPSLTDVLVLDGKRRLGKKLSVSLSKQDVLLLAASVEAGSEHPLGQAIVRGAKEQGISTLKECSDFKALVGRGVQATIDGFNVHIGNRRLMKEVTSAANGAKSRSAQSSNSKHRRSRRNKRFKNVASGAINSEASIQFPLEKEMSKYERQGKTCMLVAYDNQLVGLVAVADTIKEDSVRAIAKLRASGVHTVMITGDNERTARYIAAQVGIDDFRAGVLPDGKVDTIRALQTQGDGNNCVVMVGDGINDAPALKQANVGIAIGAGADVAIEVADVVLVGGDLSSVVSAIRLSRMTFRKIIQNLFWASFYNAAAIPLALLGLLHPMVGVAAMTISSLSVIGNSILLRRVKLLKD